MTKDEIDLFVKKLDEKEIFQDDHLIQKIIDFTDISTRLKCRQVCRKWQTLVDNSSSVGMKISKLFFFIIDL
jgi:hypothetical protein